MVRAYVHMCAAKKCYNTRLTHPDKGFFGFPSDVTQCQKWIERCGRTDLNVVSVRKSNGYYKLCADHFEEKWFTDKTKSCLNRSINPLPAIFFNNVGNLLPHGYYTNSTSDIDLPMEPVGDPDDPASLCEYKLYPSVPFLQSEHVPISYHTKPVSMKKNYDPDTISKALSNLKPETELYDIDDMCRFCMNKVLSNFIEMFSGSVEDKEIREICEIIMPKKVHICDGMPHKVCHRCIVDLKTCHKLMEQFQNADLYLRAIAKYSLFIENDDSYEVNESEEYTRDQCDNAFVKPIPTNVMVMPLKNFKPFIEKCEGYIGETDFKTTSNANEQMMSSYQDEIFNRITNKTNSIMNPQIVAISSEMDTSGTNAGTETTVSLSNSNIVVSAASISQLLQSLPLPNSQVEVITGKDLWKEDTELICSNVITLPNKDNNSKSTVTGNPNKEVIKKDQDQDLSVCALAFKKVHTESSNYVNKDDNSKKIKCSEIATSSALLSCNLNKKTSQNDYENNKDLNRIDSNFIIPYKCIECFKIFTSYESLVGHVLSIHQKFDQSRSTSTIVCSDELNNLRLLKKHIQKEHQINKFKCQKCDLGVAEYNSLVELDKHIKEKHRYSCPVCDHVFYCKEKFDEHFAAKHNGKSNCQTCENQFKNKHSRKSHEMLYKYCKEICCFCGLPFKTKSSLQQHLKLHEPSQSYPCKICGKIFCTPYALSRHKKLHDSEGSVKNFLCEICQKGFLSKENLMHHLYTHSPVKPLKCNYCGKRFIQKQTLAAHEKKHDNHSSICLKIKEVKGPFKLTETPSLECDICGRRFIKNSSVKRHRKYHFCHGNPEIIQHLLDEPEVHKCIVCGKYFFSK